MTAPKNNRDIGRALRNVGEMGHLILRRCTCVRHALGVPQPTFARHLAHHLPSPPMPSGLNYLAVLVTAVVIFILGGLWYSKALFANRWVALQGKTMEEIQASSKPTAMMFVQVFVCGLVIAYVVAVIENHFVNLSVARGAMIGVLLWLLAGATSYATSLFSSQRGELWIINSGYNLVSMVLAGIILA